jgi:hypothetical protein
MKKGENDVLLSDGEGYMVQSLPYQEHLTSSLETPQVCPCWIYTFLSPHYAFSVRHVPTIKL